LGFTLIEFFLDPAGNLLMVEVLFITHYVHFSENGSKSKKSLPALLFSQGCIVPRLENKLAYVE